jgi:hypothetical protein
MLYCYIGGPEAAGRWSPGGPQPPYQLQVENFVRPAGLVENTLARVG